MTAHYHLYPLAGCHVCEYIMPKTYSLSELSEYLGPEIDWNGDELRFLSKQVYKGFREANKCLSEIESRLKFLLMR